MTGASRHRERSEGSLSTRSVNFLCGSCEKRLSREAGAPARPCEHCGAPNEVVASVTAARCGACGHDELYFQKDFNRTTGIALVVIGAVLAPFTYFISLVLVTILDWTIWRMVKNVVVCYRCQAVHRGYGVPPNVKPFDLATHDRHVYGAAPPGAEEYVSSRSSGSSGSSGSWFGGDVLASKEPWNPRY